MFSLPTRARRPRAVEDQRAVEAGLRGAHLRAQHGDATVVSVTDCCVTGVSCAAVVRGGAGFAARLLHATALLCVEVRASAHEKVGVAVPEGHASSRLPQITDMIRKFFTKPWMSGGKLYAATYGFRGATPAEQLLLQAPGQPPPGPPHVLLVDVAPDPPVAPIAALVEEGVDRESFDACLTRMIQVRLITNVAAARDLCVAQTMAEFDRDSDSGENHDADDAADGDIDDGANGDGDGGDGKDDDDGIFFL